MSPRFSVVIPTYNQANLLQTALESVLNQTYTNFDVIVVNNNSDDHTLDVVQAFNDSRVSAINFANDGVIGAGRNRGIDATKGQYVAFLDSDDTWYPTKLEVVNRAIEEQPEVGVFCHNQELIWEGNLSGGRSSYGPTESYRESLHNYLLLVGNCLSTSATVVSRRYLNQVGLFSEDRCLITVEDYDLWIRLASTCQFRFIKEVLGVQNFRRSSAMSNVEMHMQAAHAILKKHLPEGQNIQGFGSMTLRSRYAKVYYFAARQYHRQGNIKKPLNYYVRALRTYPFHRRTYAAISLLFADIILGLPRRKKLVHALLGSSWKWG